MRPVRAGSSPVVPAMDAGAAFHAIAGACVAHYGANRAGILSGEDPEYLHQGRVALRRLRTSLGLFGPVLGKQARRVLRKDLRALLRKLGPARDWDVFVAFTLAPALAATPGNKDLEALLRRSDRFRQRAGERARRAAASWPASRLGRALRELSLLPDSTRYPARRHAREVLARCARRVRKRGKGVGMLDPAGLHRLRLAVKRMRYALHYFAPLFGKRRVEPMREALESLQHALGGANDCAVAATLLRKLRAAPGAMVARRNADKLAAHRKELRAAWKAFRAAGDAWE
ncbi:MAG: CHAD domain-containing protein [Betaproteobacteria bacterium]